MTRTKTIWLSWLAMLAVVMLQSANNALAQYAIPQGSYAQAPVAAQAANYQEYSDATQEAGAEGTTEMASWPRLLACAQFLAPSLVDPSCPPSWTVTADAVAMCRTKSTTQTLLTDPDTSTEMLNAYNMDYSFGIGPRLSLIRSNVYGHDIEFNYFSINSWDAKASFTDSDFSGGFGELQRDNTTLLVTAVNFAEHSRLYSSELNVRTPVGNWMNLLAGFRWVELYDTYDVEGTDYNTSSYFAQSVHAANHMYGFQVGADADVLHPGSQSAQFGQTMVVSQQDYPFNLRCFVKAGIYYNSADQRSNFVEEASYDSLTARDVKDTVAFVGETGFVGTYQVTQHLTLRGGYQVMWIDGVAVAAQQIPYTDLSAGSAALQTRSTLFYHGATAGMEFKW